MGKNKQGRELGQGLSQRKDGSYMARYKGKCKYYKSLKEARAGLQELIEQVDSGAFSAQNNVTLNHFFDEWIQGRLLRQEVKEITVLIYKNNYRLHIAPFLGTLKVKDIAQRHAENLQAELIKQELNPATINLCMTILHATLKAAYKKDIIGKLPSVRMAKKKPIEKQARNTIHRALTKEEQARLLDAVQGNWYETAIQMLLATGMRSGELRALKWTDIDDVAGAIHIRRTTSKGAAGAMIVSNTPKTATSARDIPLSPKIKSILNAQRRQCRELFGNRERFDRLIFVTERDKPFSDTKLVDVCKRAVKEMNEKGVKVDYFAPHALRDTFATRAIESGMDMNTLKELLGHSSLAMTADLYAHVLPNTKAAAMERLEQYV